MIDPSWADPKGVPISAIIFGGRRSTVVPLVYESFDWGHGTFMGCSVSSETTAAAEGAVGKLRHDPFAMLPFCGYNMGDYFDHWLKMGGKAAPGKLPKIYTVNWFRKDKQGKFLWPGFGDNARVLKWIFERTDGEEHGEKTPIGVIPKQGALDLKGVKLSPEQMKELFAINSQEWLNEVSEMETYLAQFGERLPAGIREQLTAQAKRLK